MTELLLAIYGFGAGITVASGYWTSKVSPPLRPPLRTKLEKFVGLLIVVFWPLVLIYGLPALFGPSIKLSRETWSARP